MTNEALARIVLRKLSYSDAVQPVLALYNDRYFRRFQRATVVFQFNIRIYCAMKLSPISRFDQVLIRGSGNNRAFDLEFSPVLCHITKSDPSPIQRQQGADE